MKKLLTACCVAAAFTAPAQTLFTYGNDTVSVPQFLQAFEKSNAGKDRKALHEYRDLYIASRLKIKEARSLRYDTLPQLVADMASLRQQILPGYLSDKESMERMINEAFVRSQKDIRVAHIFIRAGAEAEKKKEAVLQALVKQPFSTVASTYSDDPAARSNGGDIGWITAFSLPYALETVVYKTGEGKISQPYKSKGGYHIFKNLGERKAIGRISAAQILLALPPNSNEGQKKELKERADSLYRRLLAGDDFGQLAEAFSNDMVSAASRGQMADFGVGDYEPAFEDAVLRLPRDGAFSQPFLTSHGYHIVKRVKVEPVSNALTEATRLALQRRIEENDRAGHLKAALTQKVLKDAGYKPSPFSAEELQAFTDSAVRFQVPRAPVKIAPNTTLFSIRDNGFTATDWAQFARDAEQRGGSEPKPVERLWDDFVQASALNYYEQHLEEFNAAFRQQVTEFAEGNLFFEIMQQKVWTPAQTDSAGLLRFYQKHQDRYVWGESADAVMFFTTDEEAAKKMQTALRQSPGDWKELVQTFGEQVTTDSGRFELAQIPNAQKQRLVAGTVTAPVLNAIDNSYAFALVLKTYPGPAPRSFAEARGLVVNDYQGALEAAWLEELKKKYPVKINESAWANVLKGAKP